ncbi:ankyrin repeat domain-containing protein, partial [Streptomyces sp. WAC05292]|uniref:ankyrin repeat domain-containing protein n=1 Tax=Streptomyces sp. WAC05292 TaxID=2487418 RepID=UPI00163BD792
PHDPAARAEWTALLHARGDAPGAYAAAGLDRDTTLSETGVQGGRTDPHSVLAADGVDLTRLEREVRRLAAAGEGGRFTVPTGWYGLLVLRPDGARGLRVSGERRQWNADASGPRLPAFAYERLPDLELVRTGRITPRELHPLVAASLFPGAGSAAGPPGPAAPRPVRVRCRTAWHEVHSRGGTLDLLHHSAEEQRRESAMRAFGGAVTGCFAVQHAWTAPDGVRLPRALREERRELFLRVQHGDTPGVAALLDAGTDPRVRDGRGCTLLHLLPQLDHTALLPRLLDAGLSPEVRDGLGRTPLVTAVTNGGSADLVWALVAAGCRIDATDEADLSLAQIIRRFRRTDLGFLRSRVEEEFPGIGADWFDDWIEEQEEYAETDDDEDAGPDAGADEDGSA